MVFNLCLKNNKVKRVWICRDLTDIKYYMFLWYGTISAHYVSFLTKSFIFLSATA